MSRRKRILFALGAMGLSCVFLAFVELCLRLLGYGGFPPTIVEVGETDGSTLCITDRSGPASYFFANRSKPGSINPFTFRKPKPANTIRVFLAGGSAIKGFPQPMAFAPSAFLEVMLRDVWPDRNVEVINLGTTAVASFPVLGMVREAIEYEPDLVVVYSGHNEFYGAYGVASLHSAGSRPWAIALNRWARGLALVQGVDRLIGGGPVDQPEKTLMEIVIGEDFLGADDPRRAAAARNLGVHVGAMIDLCRERGIPIIVCTLPSAERNLAPLGTDDLSALSESQRGRLTAALDRAEDVLESNPSAAEDHLRTVLELHPHHARAHYLLGHAQFAMKQFEEASASFQRAIDVDPMPWRAPSASVAAIRQAAIDHSGAVLCDVQAAFRAASVGGCIDGALMDDHVHPSLAGEALLARTIVEAMTRLEGTVAVSPSAYASLPPNDEFLKRLGDNPHDRYGVAHTLRVLCDIPFIRRTNPQAFEHFNAICEDYERRFPPEVVEAARAWQKRETHAGAQRPISGMVGRAMIRLQRFTEAAQLYDVAERCVALYSSWNLEYVYFKLVCRQRSIGGALRDRDRMEARAAIERGVFLLEHGRSESGMAERWLGRLHQLLGEWEAAIPFLVAARERVTAMDLVGTDQALVMSLVHVGRLDEARRIIQTGIDHSGEYAPIYRRMLPLLSPPGKAESEAGSDSLSDP